MSPATDEIYDRYLQKAQDEFRELSDAIGRDAGSDAVPALGSGHPLGDIFLLKYGAQLSEMQEGVAFFGRAGQAILKSLQRLQIDPLTVYGTNCLKFTGQTEDDAKPYLTRELHVVQPKLIVVMGDDALRFLNELDFPLSRELEPKLGEIQQFTPTVQALVVPDIDASLDEQPAKTRFWNAFKALGPWWADLPPY